MLLYPLLGLQHFSAKKEIKKGLWFCARAPNLNTYIFKFWRIPILNPDGETVSSSIEPPHTSSTVAPEPPLMDK